MWSRDGEGACIPVSLISCGSVWSNKGIVVNVEVGSTQELVF